MALHAALLGALAVAAQAAASPAPPASQAAPLSADPARLAAQSLLIAGARAGTRLVAVGDHGVVVISDDAGGSWRQALKVPTQALLTGICFLDTEHGIAVGHDEVILTTADAGASWTRTHYAPQAQRPLLDVWCGVGGRAIAVGAYSTYLTSEDYGERWNERAFRPAGSTSGAAGTSSASSAVAGPSNAEAAPGGYHLNRIASDDKGRLYIAAEAGHLYGSDDGGGSWRTLASPYHGSFFGVLSIGGPRGESVLAFGLRGNLFRSDDAARSWQRIDSASVAMLDGAARFEDGTVAIVGLAGVVLVSHDGARSFTLLQQADHAGLSAALPAGDRKLVALGERGAKVIALDPPAGRDP